MKAKTIAPFQLYQASAGAGKTFLLVQKYLANLLSHKQEDRFHRMLALTFTNKAVYEMKFRLLKQLHFFAFTDEDLALDAMGKALLKELEISSDELKKRAEINLHLILHDYAAFDVITLDSFTHRVIRSFAKDLGLAYNFEVELQSERILEKVVERVIDEVGEDPQITQLLKQFTFQKMDDDSVTSWDLKNNLLNSAQLLLNENDREEIKRFIHFTNKTVDESYRLLIKERTTTHNEFVALGKRCLGLISEAGLEASHFSHQTLYKRFYNVSTGNFNKYDSGKLHENLIAGKGIYTTKTPEAAKAQIDALLPRFLQLFEEGLLLFYKWQLLSDMLKQWIPLNMLATLAKTLEIYQTESNRVLISTFNERIAKEILWQPSPYIYERLGENYRHYFLDEFQDTSSLQWNNLIPLIKSSIESELESGHTGSLLLVGDPKQSIYRWRGGNVEQFIDLIHEGNPFTIAKKKNNLKTNYRSAKAIVTFNNALYAALPEYITFEENKSLFGDEAFQELNNETEGYVRLSFIQSKNDTEEDAYAVSLIEDAKRCHDNGYSWGDMAILVRTKKQAQSIASSLSQANLPYTSSESLLMEQSPAVNFLMTLVYLYSQPDNLHQKKMHLTHLFDEKKHPQGLHDYLYQNLHRPVETLWKEEGIAFNLNWLDQRSLFAVFQLACSRFPFLAINDVFTLGFLDEVFDFSLREQADISSFIRYWEQQLKQKTIVQNQSDHSIKLMTIHQAKGLEFPIVFFPYADRPIHPRTKDKIWLDTSRFLGEDFPMAWVNQSERLNNYGTEGILAHQRKLVEEEIDAWNVFYVATTRASEQLFMYAAEEQINKNTYAAFLAEFVDYKGDEYSFEWGTKEGKQDATLNQEHSPTAPIPFSIYPYEEKLMLQRKTSKEREQARRYGIKIHEAISKIHYADELENTLEEAAFRGEITSEEKASMFICFDQLINTSIIAPYFSRSYTVLNEQAILVPETKILRPDRIVYNSQEAVVIDYKTGVKNENHQLQIQDYAQHIAAIFKRPVTAYLVYMNFEANNQIEIIEVPMSKNSVQ